MIVRKFSWKQIARAIGAGLGAAALSWSSFIRADDNVVPNDQPTENSSSAAEADEAFFAALQPGPGGPRRPDDDDWDRPGPRGPRERVPGRPGPARGGPPPREEERRDDDNRAGPGPNRPFPPGRSFGEGGFGGGGFGGGFSRGGGRGFGPPGFPPGPPRGESSPGELDERISRLEHKLDQILNELRELNEHRPPLPPFAGRGPGGGFGPRMAGGPPHRPMGPPPFARDGHGGPPIGPPHPEANQPRRGRPESAESPRGDRPPRDGEGPRREGPRDGDNPRGERPRDRDTGPRGEGPPRDRETPPPPARADRPKT